MIPAPLCVRVSNRSPHPQLPQVNLKTAFNESMPEYTYQAGFSTVAGEWVTVDLPFAAFIAVKMGNELRGAPPLDASTVRSLGMVLSRFEFNGLPNAAAVEGPFRLEVQQVRGASVGSPTLTATKRLRIVT